MRTRKADSGSRLLHAALKVTYRHGFGPAALADIAKAARIPLGNVYYHFKTKEELGKAIIERRRMRLRAILKELDKAESPKERLCGFVQIKIADRRKLARTGCPVGTLCSELQKRGGAAARKSRILFAEALAWMETQFRSLGHQDESRGLAVHLLSATQGVSLLAHTFHDPGLVDIEAKRLKDWIRALEPGGSL